MNPVASFFSKRPSTGDWIGGFSVALVLIPQSIAYATIAGLPPSCGLFAATLPLLVAAPLVSCPWIQTGPTALASLLTAGALASVSFQAPGAMLGAAAILALVVGITRLLLGLARLGSFTKLLSKPVVLGFTTAAAILIISSQLSKTLGTDNSESHVLVRAAMSVLGFRWSPEAIIVALATGSIAYWGRKIHRLFPSIFIAVIAAILYSMLRGYEGATVGALPGGFLSPSLNLPFQHLPALLFPGIVIAFVGFAEPASIAMTLMEEEKLTWSPNRELCGGGLANIMSGLIGGYPVGGSFSRTSINKFAGSTSSWSGMITGAVVLSMLWLTPLLSPLPQAALGAIIIVAVIRLLKFKEIRQTYQDKPIQGAVAIVTMVATIAFAPRVDIGIVFGASLGMLVNYIERQQSTSVDEDGQDT